MLAEKIHYEQPPPASHQADLERQFMEEYLQERGYCLADLRRLPRDLVRKLMCGACRHASLKLAELEARAAFVDLIKLPV